MYDDPKINGSRKSKKFVPKSEIIALISNNGVKETKCERRSDLLIKVCSLNMKILRQTKVYANALCFLLLFFQLIFHLLFVVVVVFF